MIYHFPHEVAYLPRTKLSYINLPGLLSDGKRDRAARVPGFVAINLGDICYLIFLRKGEPFHAARITSAGREQIAIAEVLRIAAEEIDHGEAGSIAYYGASEEQLRTMLATLMFPEIVREHGLETEAPEHLLPALRERGFTGVVELSGGRDANYLCFEDGHFDAGYFCRREAALSLAEVVRAMFEAAGPGLRVGLFAALLKLPLQAPPGLVELYRRLVETVELQLSERFGAEAVINSLRTAQQRVTRRYPIAEAYLIRDDGGIGGYPIASPEDLTDAVAAWLTELLAAGSDESGIDPADVLARATRDQRFVLAEQGFFGRLPWLIVV
jgi:hypothetical protein